MGNTHHIRLRRTRSAASLIVALALGLLLGGCGGSDDTEGRPASSDRGPETPDVTVALLPQSATAPFYIGLERGFFKEEGLNVKVRDVQNGAVGISALASGGVQATILTYPSLLLATQTGLELSLLTENTRGKEGYAGVYTLPDSAIREPADLLGKRVGVVGLNNLPDVTLNAAMKAQGLDYKQIKYVEIPFPQMNGALERGDVDAAWISGPFVASAERELDARLVLDPLKTDDGYLTEGGYAVTREFAQENPNTVAAFQRASAKAARIAAEEPDEVARILPTYLPLKPNVAKQVPQPEFVSGVELSRLARFERVMRDIGTLQQAVDIDALAPGRQ